MMNAHFMHHGKIAEDPRDTKFTVLIQCGNSYGFFSRLFPSSKERFFHEEKIEVDGLHITKTTTSFSKVDNTLDPDDWYKSMHGVYSF